MFHSLWGMDDTSKLLYLRILLKDWRAKHSKHFLSCKWRWRRSWCLYGHLYSAIGHKGIGLWFWRLLGKPTVSKIVLFKNVYQIEPWSISLSQNNSSAESPTPTQFPGAVKTMELYAISLYWLPKKPKKISNLSWSEKLYRFCIDFTDFLTNKQSSKVVTGLYMVEGIRSGMIQVLAVKERMEGVTERLRTLSVYTITRTRILQNRYFHKSNNSVRSGREELNLNNWIFGSGQLSLTYFELCSILCSSCLISPRFYYAALERSREMALQFFKAFLHFTFPAFLSVFEHLEQQFISFCCCLNMAINGAPWLEEKR